MDSKPGVEKVANPTTPPAGGVSRRAFLGEITSHAKYAAPVVFMLAVMPERAAAASGCIPSGIDLYNACTTNEECCSNNCVDIDPDVGVIMRCQAP